MADASPSGVVGVGPDPLQVLRGWIDGGGFHRRLSIRFRWVCFLARPQLAVRRRHRSGAGGFHSSQERGLGRARQRISRRTRSRVVGTEYAIPFGAQHETTFSNRRFPLRGMTRVGAGKAMLNFLREGMLGSRFGEPTSRVNRHAAVRLSRGACSRGRSHERHCGWEAQGKGCFGGTSSGDGR